MVVDDMGDLCITNDGATILQRLEIKHPAAKVLVELAELQDREVGDGEETMQTNTWRKKAYEMSST
jgi:T-complex protein 1 subunit alpha